MNETLRALYPFIICRMKKFSSVLTMETSKLEKHAEHFHTDGNLVFHKYLNSTLFQFPIRPVTMYLLESIVVLN